MAEKTEVKSFFDITQYLSSNHERMKGLLVVAAYPDATSVALGATPHQALMMLRHAAEYIAEAYEVPLYGVIHSIVDDETRAEIEALAAEGLDVAPERLEKPKPEEGGEA